MLDFRFWIGADRVIEVLLRAKQPRRRIHSDWRRLDATEILSIRNTHAQDAADRDGYLLFITYRSQVPSPQA